jgi:hypothetical protein
MAILTRYTFPGSTTTICCRSPSDLPTGTTGRRIFAYIICINDYEAEKVPKLRACVEDGKKFEGFLRARFHDQALQIQSLYNEAATYDAMLSLFTKASANRSIQKGDMVIFFYAGHGSRMPGPEGWKGRIETICPYDVDTTKDGKTIYGIPDFVVGTVMTKLANAREANVVSLCFLHRLTTRLCSILITP